MRMSKTLFCIITFILIFSTAITPVFAHSGKTDSSGGHYDTSTGEYHYHHGYSAHSHPNGECPYQTSNSYEPSYSSNSSAASSSNSDDNFGFVEFLLTVLFVVVVIAIAYILKNLLD